MCTLQFSVTEYKEFRKQFKEEQFPGLRFGQAFYNYFRLEKITQTENRIWCDTIYVCEDRLTTELQISKHLNWDN